MRKPAIFLMMGAVLFSAAITTATAAEVKIGETGYLRSPDGKTVALFKSQSGIAEAMTLYKAGADEFLLGTYLSCIVPNETKVLVITGQITGAFMSGADQTSDVMVITGPNAGCKGVVPNIFVKK